MNSFRYQAIELDGKSTEGVIEAEDRKSALQQLGKRGLFPSNLELCPTNGKSGGTISNGRPAESSAPRSAGLRPGTLRFGSGIKRKQITAFTREMSALLSAAIPIPQALTGIGEEEENPALREMILNISESVRKGASFSAGLAEHPRVFSGLYVSMVRVGEEAGQLQAVMNDLANLLEHEDEVRGEVIAAVSYPAFVLSSGVVTVGILLTFVMPKLANMLKETLPVLPLPTRILLGISGFFQHYWYWIVAALIGVGFGLRRYLSTPRGAERWDGIKLQLPVVGGVFQMAALSRFARTLGTLTHSGVSLLPALKIVEDTIGNRVLAKQVARVAEETRGGDSLAAPLRKLNIFPRTVVQMIDVGEESGTLDQMLLKVAAIEERNMRGQTKILISLLAPILIVGVGILVGFIVISLLLPIFKIASSLR
jgi:type II secretory pathway component PulF